jgi:hypothetical protein
MPMMMLIDLDLIFLLSKPMNSKINWMRLYQHRITHIQGHMHLYSNFLKIHGKFNIFTDFLSQLNWMEKHEKF